MVIGTHAVISEAVEFAGWGWRWSTSSIASASRSGRRLQAKGGEQEPHVLALTATPIPRTLALTFYGDLSISTLRHLPPGRQPIRTELRDRSALPKIEGFIAAEAAEGGRASWSCRWCRRARR